MPARRPFVAKKSITYASIRDGNGLPAGLAGHRQDTFVSGGLRGHRYHRTRALESSLCCGSASYLKGQLSV